MTKNVKQAMKELFEKAHNAGMNAGNSSYDHGPCGFASINVRGNSRFGKYLLESKMGRKSPYRGGIDMFIHHFGQSGNKKIRYAYAFARILEENGITCKIEARDD